MIKVVLDANVLVKKLHRKSPKWIKAFLMELGAKAELTPGKLVVDAVKNDPTDNIYLTCAVEGHADFIISGDRHLTELKAFQGIRIMSPATFLTTIPEQDEI